MDMLLYTYILMNHKLTINIHFVCPVLTSIPYLSLAFFLSMQMPAGEKTQAIRQYMQGLSPRSWAFLQYKQRGQQNPNRPRPTDKGV